MVMGIAIGSLLLIGALAGALYTMYGSSAAAAEQSHDNAPAMNAEQYSMAVEMNLAAGPDATSVQITGSAHDNASVTGEDNKGPDNQKLKIVAAVGSTFYLMRSKALSILRPLMQRGRSFKIMIG